MHRRKFLLTSVALASIWEITPAAAQTKSDKPLIPASTRVAVAFSGLSAGPKANANALNVGKLSRGLINLEVNMWLRLDVDAPPAGGILIQPTFRVFEGAIGGGIPILTAYQFKGKSAPNVNEVHITGKSGGVNHDDLFRGLELEISMTQAVAIGAGGQTAATVSTVPGKDSYIIVSCG